MEMTVLWTVEWDNGVKGLRGWWRVRFIDPLMWQEKADFGRARHVGIHLCAVGTLLRYPRDTTLCSFIHLFTFSFT